MDSIENDPLGTAIPIHSQVLRLFFPRFIMMLFGLGLYISAVAQTPAVPRSPFYVRRDSDKFTQLN